MRFRFLTSGPTDAFKALKKKLGVYLKKKKKKKNGKKIRFWQEKKSSEEEERVNVTVRL